MIFSARSSQNLIAAAFLMLSGSFGVQARGCDSCDVCAPVVALRTNLVHDALLTPDLGVELAIGRHFSISGQGMWAWWSKSERNLFWRIYGGGVEVRWWFGERNRYRSLSGHHAGFYSSVHSFDFELGGKGWQSPSLIYGVGVSYGYSLPVNERLNIDFGMRLGYVSGKMVQYEPQCGTYVCTGRVAHRYIGPTAVEISLVWFPGSGRRNNPNRGL